MTYPEAIEFLYGLRQFGTKLGLDNVRRLIELAGSPHKELQFIHVAGTNGKGSVCAMLEGIYRAHGLRTGMFTSPHLVSFAERIQVDRTLIPEETVARLLGELRPLLTSFPEGEHPTFFEVIVVMALRYFAETSCDVVLWETGMGGRLDATNIVDPLVSVITNVDLDHQRWLGTDLASIAREKAGIVKPGVPVVTCVDQPEAWSVVSSMAEERGAPLIHVISPMDPDRLNGDIGLAGVHQWMNAALAARVVEVLGERWPVDPAVMARALREVSWPGRLQTVLLPQGPALLLDGAHNLGGFRMLCTHLEGREGWHRPAWLVGFLEEKDRAGLWDGLRSRCSRLAIVPLLSMNTAPPEEVAAEAREALPGVSVSVHASVPDAWSELKRESHVIVTGSLYLVGEVMAFLELSGNKAEPELNEWGPNKTS